METRVENAVSRHGVGHNCAQSVVCAYSDLFGIDEDLAFRFAEGFGGGMGGMHDGACGAVTAMYMLAGMKAGVGSPEKGTTKPWTYAQVRALHAAFYAKNGTVLCADLLGETENGLQHACNDCIADAARIVEALLLDGADA